MPKRVLDGEGIWRSDKLSRVEPPRRRAEYANLVPLALANGTFEASPRRIWSTVYSYNRPDITESEVDVMLKEFERVKLLFRWTVIETGKLWGYWIGIDKPGRLPGKSRRGRNETVGPEPPADALRKFLELSGVQMFPQGNEELLGSGSGLGLGLGSGYGSGSGKPSDATAPEGDAQRQSSRNADPRHSRIRDLIQELHFKQFCVKCVWDASEGKSLDLLLTNNPAWTLDQLASMVRNRFASDGLNGARPRKWLSNLSDYAAGPLDRYGKSMTRNANVTNRAERDEQQTHNAIANAARRYVSRHSAGQIDGMGQSNVTEATID